MFALRSLPQRWLVFHEKMKTTKVYVRETTAVRPEALLLFGGAIEIQHERSTITVDRWITFKAPAKVAVLFKELRRRLDALLIAKIESPSLDFSSGDHRVVSTICALLRPASAHQPPAGGGAVGAALSAALPLRARVAHCRSGCSLQAGAGLWADPADGHLYCRTCWQAEYGRAPLSEPVYCVADDGTVLPVPLPMAPPSMPAPVSGRGGGGRDKPHAACTSGCALEDGASLWRDPTDNALYCRACWLAQYARTPATAPDEVWSATSDRASSRKKGKGRGGSRQT